jgi:hypothetical protein
MDLIDLKGTLLGFSRHERVVDLRIRDGGSQVVVGGLVERDEADQLDPCGC